jgi:group I intron endonuclease
MDFIVYKATNLINGKSYIGITRQGLLERVKQHLKESAGGRGHVLHKAIRKYGVVNFTFEPVAFCGNGEEMKSMEMYCIARFGTKLPRGYNMTDGGEGMTGHLVSDETRRKLSAAKKGIRPPESAIEKTRERLKRDNPAWGIGARLKISVAMRGWYQKNEHPRGYTGRTSVWRKKVICLDTGEVFSSITEASARYGGTRSNIASCIAGRLKTSHGHRWAYVEEAS